MEKDGCAYDNFTLVQKINPSQQKLFVSHVFLDLFWGFCAFSHLVWYFYGVYGVKEESSSSNCWLESYHGVI